MNNRKNRRSELLTIRTILNITENIFETSYKSIWFCREISRDMTIRDQKGKGRDYTVTITWEKNVLV